MSTMPAQTEPSTTIRAKTKQATSSLASKKRKHTQESVDLKAAVETPPAKRLRSNDFKENNTTGPPSHASFTATRKPLTKVPRTYGKKNGRTSSPALSSHAHFDVNYDEVPKAPATEKASLSVQTLNTPSKNAAAIILDTGKTVTGVATRTRRAAAMKNKDNEIAATAPVVKGAAAKKVKAATQKSAALKITAAPELLDEGPEASLKAPFKHPETTVKVMFFTFSSILQLNRKPGHSKSEIFDRQKEREEKREGGGLAED